MKDLQKHNVKMLVRCCDNTYNDEDFTSRGIQVCVSLEFFVRDNLVRNSSSLMDNYPRIRTSSGGTES